MIDFRAQLNRDGFAIIHRLIESCDVERLKTALSLQSEDSGTHQHRGSFFAQRNLLQIKEIRDFAESDCIREMVEAILGSKARVVRGIMFDKTAEANWLVPWHQDLSIAVKTRVDTPGFGPWSVKAGVVHVQPQEAILREMITLRLHLDDCASMNGPLRVIPGSHRRVLDTGEIRREVEAGCRMICTLPAGGALLMRPLILHSSSRAKRLADGE